MFVFFNNIKHTPMKIRKKIFNLIFVKSSPEKHVYGFNQIKCLCNVLCCDIFTCQKWKPSKRENNAERTIWFWISV